VSAALEDARTLGDQIARELGPGRVRTPNEIECLAAQTIVEPHSTEEISAIIRKCAADKISLAPLGAARTLAQLRRAPAQIGISLKRMASIVAYEPEDMTVVTQAGLTIGDLNATLATRGQRLPVDPRDPSATTLGSLIAAAHAGPLRLSEGTVRDLLIGIQFVGHGGRLIRAGGRVVKNVAGYDLMKVLTGSFGTLGIVTEACFKVRPIPENYTLAVATFPDADAAFAAASTLHDQVPLIHLEVASPGAGTAIGTAARFVVLAGFGGIRSELAYQSDRIASVLGPTIEMFDGDRALELYSLLRDLSFGDDAIAARMALLPNELARCARESSAEFSAHIGSGIAELSTRAADPGVVARWREMAHSARGHLRVVSAPASIRSQIEFFDRPNPGAFKLMQRLKSTFDPAGIFNPGCFVGAL
jgi:glycolate oxidase FAD binding subunit